jgi:hypothetical protein
MPEPTKYRQHIRVRVRLRVLFNMKKQPYTTTNIRGVLEAKEQIMRIVMWYRNYFVKGGSKEKVPCFSDVFEFGEKLEEVKRYILKIAFDLKQEERRIHELAQINPYHADVQTWNVPQNKKHREVIYKAEEKLNALEFSFLGEDIPQKPQIRIYPTLPPKI